ncbi:MAG: tetratricopeptide repeat protein [Myxococcales bacterium]|nr:tetratricopeptide repeat protein [Myxococcales bacterium]
MSLLRKILGGKSAAEERAAADALFEAGDFGLAKLAYERTQRAARKQRGRDRSGSDSGDALSDAALERRIEQCCDALAEGRIAEAERLLAEGNERLAFDELSSALETARSQAVIDRAREIAAGYERQDARQQAQLPELSLEERFELIAGNFEDAQDAEYRALGPELVEALVALHEGEAERALPVLEQLYEGAQARRFLHYEVGRARLLTGDREGGQKALESFLESLADDEHGEACLGAHMELAALLREAGDFEGAVARLQQALEAMPEDPRPYLAMGRFFRGEGLPTEALEVLASAEAVLQQSHYLITLERGLAHADLEQDRKAAELLESVVEELSARGQLDLPPEGTRRLAELHEKAGNRARAADLYRILASGSHVEGHFDYHHQAARLMAGLGNDDEARRMLQRALELAPDDEALRGRLQDELAQLS